MDKKYIILFAFLLVVPMISGQLIFEQGKNINISIPCDVNGTECSTAASCNYSVFAPDYTKIKNHTTNLGVNSAFYVFINSSQSQSIGTYYVNIWCEDVGETTKTTFEFEITQTGTNLSTAQGIVYIVFLLAILFIFSVVLYFSIKIPFGNYKRGDDDQVIGVNDLKWVKVFLICMSYILLMFIFGIMRSITANFLSLDNASGVFNWMYWIMLSFLWPIIVVSFILIIIYAVDGKRMRKILARGVQFR